MALKQDFTEQLQGQIAVWQGQIKDYQERLAQAPSGYEPEELERASPEWSPSPRGASS